MSHKRDWVGLSDEEVERLKGERVSISALAHRRVLHVLENGLRSGADEDAPEGTRNLTMSDTLAKTLARDLRGRKTMLKRVHKFPLPKQSTAFDIRLPRGAQPLKLMNQRGEPQLWALVDPKAKPEPRRFALLPTGADVPHNARYVDTAMFDGGHIVAHLFELPPTTR